MGHNRNLADYAHHFDGTNIDLGSGNIETEGVVTYEDVTNVDSVGIITARAGVKVPDSQKIFLGTGDDLQIYHDGSHSYIDDAGTGNLYLRSGTLPIQNLAGSKTSAVFNSGGGQELYHNNSKKFETTTTGATVTGTLVSDSVTSELDLSAISASISDTAVDVFVYDTRKDSDGGAWRKRTQNTSWYNETLGTATRGSRKEFPAVAVIVTETSQVTIYDGDDPDLPMWMVFNSGSGNALWYNNGATATVMLNGKLANSSNNNQRFRTIDFITDSHLEYSHTDGRTTFGINISQRNAGVGSFNYGNVSGSGLINRYCNDVAMTVLPNAPVDSATGLPVPTIAVGTDDGVSVIKDDGTVISTASSSSGYHIEKVDFTDDHGLNVHIDSNSGGNKALVYVDDFNKLNGFSYGTYSNWDGVLYANRYAANVLTYRTLSQGSGFPISDFISMSGTDAAVGSNFTAGGLTLLAKNNEAPGQGMVAFVTSDYNTGYMQGDIKRAFLSDTDTTNAVAKYYDNFANNDKGWSFADNGSSGISGGNLTIEQNGSARATDSDALNGVATGTKLTITLTVSGSGTGNLILDDDGSGAGVGGNTNYGLINATGSYTFNAYKTASNRLRFIRSTGSNNYDVNFLNISTEYDRSVNDKGIGVYGTITKSAVATGADLVAYSGFSASNYLQQPYNSDLDFGTGDFSIMFWYKVTSGDYTTQCFVHRGDGDVGTWGSGKIIQIEFNGTNLAAFLAESAFSSFDTVAIPGATAASGKWQHYTLIRRGTFVGAYLDGELKDSTSSNRDLSNTAAKTWIGERPNSSRPLDTTSLALFRMSASAPSPEQIKKIYEDERMLFQENAKATLYGSSDAVTALGYDEDIELLHVGTSAGRSDFQRLRRINNTTTAVTTAISASDELIAEQ